MKIPSLSMMQYSLSNPIRDIAGLRMLLVKAVMSKTSRSNSIALLPRFSPTLVVCSAIVLLSKCTLCSQDSPNVTIEGRDDEFNITYDSDSSSYYILREWDGTNGITRPEEMKLGRNETDHFQAKRVARSRFFQVQSVPIDRPLDIDGDGLSDVYELTHPEYFHPLNRQDGEFDYNRNGVSDAEDLKSGVNPLTSGRSLMALQMKIGDRWTPVSETTQTLYIGDPVQLRAVPLGGARFVGGEPKQWNIGQRYIPLNDPGRGLSVKELNQIKDDNGRPKPHQLSRPMKIESAGRQSQDEINLLWIEPSQTVVRVTCFACVKIPSIRHPIQVNSSVGYEIKGPTEVQMEVKLRNKNKIGWRDGKEGKSGIEIGDFFPNAPAGEEGEPGVTFHGKVGGVDKGQIAFWQIVERHLAQTCDIFQDTNECDELLKVNEIAKLDGGIPYKNTIVSVGSELKSWDSPYYGLKFRSPSHWRTARMRFVGRFRTYLMYNSGSDESVWIPLKSQGWEFKAEYIYQGEYSNFFGVNSTKPEDWKPTIRELKHFGSLKGASSPSGFPAWTSVIKVSD